MDEVSTASDAPRRGAVARIILSPRFLPALFAGALLVRLLWCLLFLGEPRSDATWYFRTGEELARGLGYRNGHGVLSAFFPVGYPLFLAALFRITGASIAAAAAANIILDLGALALVVSLGRRLFGSELTGRLAALLLALLPSQVAFCSLVYTEVLFTFLMLLVMRLLLARRHLFTATAAAGLAAGLGYLVKPQFLILPPLYLLFLAARRPRVPGAAARGLAVVALMLAAAGLWTARNWRVFHAFIPASTNGGVNLFIGNSPRATGTFTNVKRLVRSLPEGTFDDFRHDPMNIEASDADYRRLGWSYIREDPGRFLALVPRKLSHLYRSDAHALEINARGVPPAKKRLLRRLRLPANLIYWAVLLLAAAALALRAGGGGRGRGFSLLPAAAVALMSAVYALIFGLGRYHHPMMPWIALYAAWGLAAVIGARTATACSRAT